MPAFFLSPPGAIATLGFLALLAQTAANRPASRLGRTGQSPSATALVMQVVLSLVVVASALYVILFKPDAPEDHKWAYGAIALVLGFWLRGALS